MKKLSFTKLNENKDSEFILKNCNFTHSKTSVFDPIKEGLFCAAHRWGEQKGLAMMKLGTAIPYLKKIQEICELRDTPYEFCWQQRFFNGNLQILLYE